MNKDVFEVFVPGVPSPQGSKRLILNRGRPHMIESSPRHKNWRLAVSQTALDEVARGKFKLLDGPVALAVKFFFVRPASHFGKRGLKSSAPPFPKAFDLDKLVRSVGDSLTGIVYRDDVEIVLIVAKKQWGESVGASVKVWAVERQQETEAKSERLPGI